MESADLLLHPVRLRIVQAFLGDRALTTGALAAELADVPPATLYRQVARLVDAGVLQVVVEQLVRGAVQRTYTLRASAAVITPDQVAAMSAADMRQAFVAFVAGLLGDVDRYLARDAVDPVRDGANFRLAGLWLDDAEFTTLLQDLMRVLQPAAAKPPGPGRKRRILATVMLPGEEATPSLPGGEATVAPRGGEATVAPRGGEATVAPRGGEATVAPRGGEATVAPRGGEAKKPTRRKRRTT